MRLNVLVFTLGVVLLAEVLVLIPPGPPPSGGRYARLEAIESHPPATEKATFAMGCYYHGEERLGSLDGVLETRAGILDGREVVEVTFDPSELPFEQLLRDARKLECTSRVYAHTDDQLRVAEAVAGNKAVRLSEPARDAIPRDRLFSLGTSNLRYLPLTPMQATKINADLGLQRGDGTAWLSPHQLELLARIEATLKKDPYALDGLERPSDPAVLPAYEVELVERLIPTAGKDQ